ncbi:MAG: DUF1837 domain-containing protein [Bacteroidetes bacterium]|nr:DUF1837 domain-containing protein [Bacteroidota bacterium]
MTEEELRNMTTCTQMFMNHVHWVQQSFNLLPNKEHYGTCINYIDRQEFREEFCKELVNTITEWIYSQTEAEKILNNFIAQGRTNLNAQAALVDLTFEKFRNKDCRELVSQGQFGELLLFNLLQSFFSAVPLLRKMPITTSGEMERYGADAIHYTFKGGKNILYLGEAKTYTSKYQFNTAFKDAIESILNTYQNHRKELGLYVYDSFINEPLTNIAIAYKNGTLKNTEIHLVSIITYCENKSFEKNSEKEIKENIINIIAERGQGVDRKLFDQIEDGLLPRLNYIVFPIWELDELISQFQKRIGK